MRVTHSRRRGLPARALLLAALIPLLLLLASNAQARPDKKFTVGVGIAGSTLSGDLDGNRVLVASGASGPQVLVAEPAGGGGVTIMGAIQVNPFFAAEAHLIATGHEAKHQATPGVDYDASVASLLAGGRFMLPVGESFELFGRAGLGLLSVSYTRNASLPPNPTPLDSDFSGLQLAAGGGVAAFFDPLGAELSVLFQRGSLSSLNSAGISGDLQQNLAVGITTVLLTVTMHFGSL